MPVSTISELCSVQPPPPQVSSLQQQQQQQQHKVAPTPIIHPQGASTSSSSSLSCSGSLSPASPILLQQSPPSPASVSSPSSPAPAASGISCPHCQELEYGGEQQRPVYWRIQLDRDLLETILAIYPEWFKDCNLDLLSMAEGSSGGNIGGEGGSSSGSTGHPLSPPKAEVDDSPLQKCMDKNKESLKVKLMLRRPINQLVAQGIMPPLKTPPAFHEQRQKLERAKMGDLLKAKIQQRPDRQELVRQHILEDVGHVDPSLAERQRMLKKARLQDSLNDQLSHRPGPLELIKKNILHTDETIERAVKEGQIPFRATCEGQLTKPQHPNRYITYEEDSSSEGGHSPPQHSTLLQTAQGQLLLSTANGTVCFEAGQSVMVPVSVVSCPPAPAPSPSVTSSTSSLSPISSVASPQSMAPSPALVATPILTLPAPPPPPPPPLPAAQPAPVTTTITVQHISTQPAPVVTLPSPPTPAPTPVLTAVTIPTPRPISRAEKEQNLKNRKKSKTKSQPKTRTIKFHEYKGPPNAQKASNNSPPPVETSYELLLQQQQLFLQWQLEWQHKYPQIILPAAQKPSSSDSCSGTSLPSLIAVTTSPATMAMTQPSTPSPTPQQTLSQQQQQPVSLVSVPSPAPSLASPAPPTPQPVTVIAAPATPSAPATPAPPTPTPTPTPAPEPVVRTVSKLEDMKVSDLKIELKKRNLPVSGSKPQLIDRLRPFSEQMGMQAPPSQQQQQQQQQQQASPAQQQQHCHNSLEQPATPSSVSSVQSHLEPRSVATLALGDDSLSGLSMDTPVSPMGDTGILSLDSCLSPDDSNSSSGGGSLNQCMSQPSSPLSLGPMSHPACTSLMSPATHMDVDLDMGAAMDTSAPDTPGSPLLQAPSPISPPSPPQQVLLPLVSEDIITQQQRKIEQLQRELQKSQQQLHRIKSKEQLQVTTANNQPASVNPGDVSTKNHLQQHLQHKIQQQQLQEQLQQLQHLQSLQQQQQQQQLTLRQQQQQQANTVQLQQGLSAKASLAAFLQQQQQQQQQTVTPLLLSISTTVPAQPLNNNNNNNNVTVAINNKNTSKNQQRQQKLTLNQINLQKQKSAAVQNGLTTAHQRTASLPNFFGSFSQQQQQQQPQQQQQQQQPQQQQIQIQVAPVVQQPTKLLTTQNSEPNFLISKPPPPLYEEAAKLLKVKQEPNSQTATNKQKHIKSQIVDDVLEILIKNGELPPSAAQDPATPTTPGQSMPQGLVFKSPSQLAVQQAETPPPPPPPPPPPLPQQPSFSLGLSSLLGENVSLQSSKSHCSAAEEAEAFTSHLDMILGQTGNNPQPMNITPHTPTEMPSSTPAPTIDLKDLGLDLETLDTMDFSQLDPIKLEASDLLEEKLSSVQSDCTRDECEEEPMEGVVSAGDMPMDLDVSDWLESLLPSTSCPPSPSQHQQHLQQQQSLSTSHISHNNALSMFGLQSSGSDLDTYDPLLCNSQDVFDLFNLEDTDLKMTPSDINNLNWDKVDFAT